LNQLSISLYFPNALHTLAENIYQPVNMNDIRVGRAKQTQI